MRDGAGSKHLLHPFTLQALRWPSRWVWMPGCLDLSSLIVENPSLLWGNQLSPNPPSGTARAGVFSSSLVLILFFPQILNLAPTPFLNVATLVSPLHHPIDGTSISRLSAPDLTSTPNLHSRCTYQKLLPGNLFWSLSISGQKQQLEF